MDLLKAEIERKRKKITQTGVVEPAKKFFKRGDLAAKQSDDYWKKYYEKHGDKRAAVNSKTVTEEDALELLESKTKELPRVEVIRQFRERGEPILVFGENEADALRRLRKLIIDNPDLKPGYRNDFQDALGMVDQDFVNEVIQGTHKESGKHDIKLDQHLLTFDEIKFIMQKWGVQLNERAEDAKRTAKGKYDSGMHRQTIEHCRPLFQKLKNKSVPSDIRVHLVRIVQQCLQKNYIEANNDYMNLAIGNAPWPVGVTRSGIHQRPGSAKSYVANIAHVLNDETQRKFVQGLKRIMTKCQEFNPTDPSRSVDFTSKHG